MTPTVLRLLLSIRRFQRLLLIALGMGTAFHPASLRAQPGPLDGFDAYVEAARKAWQVPGLAVAVVQGDSVVFAKGYGVRNLDSGEPVDVHTLFSNASTTKAFVAMALGMLVDEGKVDFDAPVIEYLPDSRVADPYVTRELTVRDLLTHRTGTAPANLWARGVDDDDEYVRRLRFAEQESSLRSQYEYDNDMFVVAGKVIQAVSGQPWEAVVEERILGPLGMDETMTSGVGATDRPNVATAHNPVDDTLRVVPYPEYPGVSAAGAMRSTVDDMTRWVRALLDSTRFEGGRLLEPATFAELFRPQTIIKGPAYPAARQADPHFSAYGLGWFLQDYRGRLLAMHTGSLRGANALVGLLPEEQLGLIVFANRSNAELRHALMYEVFDRFLGPTGKDWSGDLLALYRPSDAPAERDERIPGTRPSLDPEAYAGTYADSLYGRVEVRMGPEGLVATTAGTVADLQHWHYDTFNAVYRERAFGETKVRFELDAQGRAVRLHTGDVTFEREP